MRNEVFDLILLGINLLTKHVTIVSYKNDGQRVFMFFFSHQIDLYPL